MTRSITVSQEVLLAAADLAKHGEFSEWDLTVSAWKRNPNRFGCRGYEDLYPDHKRVMMEIMGKKKVDNPLRRGWMERTRPNYYHLTALGLAEAERVKSAHISGPSTFKSAAATYDAVLPYVNHRVFKAHSQNEEEPKTWLGVEAFLGLSRNDSLHLRDRMQAATNAAQQALRWLDESGETGLRRTASSGLTLRRSELETLAYFISQLEERFPIQFRAVLKMGKGT